MNEPFFSAIVTTHNRSGLVARAIESIALQRGASFELIVVDDASTDDTAAVLCNLAERIPLRIVMLPTNRGVTAARNEGARAAMGRWIVFLDDDDYLVPEAFSRIVRTIHHADTALYFGRCVDHTGVGTGRAVKGAFVKYRDYLAGYVQGEFLPVVRRDVFLRRPFFDDIVGGEATTWTAIIRDNGDAYVADSVWRVYDRSGIDRLSVKHRNYARLARVHAKDIRLFWRDYLRYAPFRLLSKIVKIFVYRIASFIYRA